MILMQASGVDTRYFKGIWQLWFEMNWIGDRFWSPKCGLECGSKLYKLTLKDPIHSHISTDIFSCMKCLGWLAEYLKLRYMSLLKWQGEKFFPGSPHKTVHWVYDAMWIGLNSSPKSSEATSTAHHCDHTRFLQWCIYGHCVVQISGQTSRDCTELAYYERTF